MVGCITGSIIGGIQCGKLGRRTSMLSDSMVYTAGLLLLTFSPNFYVTLISRFILGHAGASAIVAVPMYVGEMMQPQVRNSMSALTVVCFSCGVSLTLGLGKTMKCYNSICIIEFLLI